MHTVQSHNKVLIRLTSERWEHIVENHIEMAGRIEEVLKTVQSPDYILQGNMDEIIAVSKVNDKQWIVVPYKEVDNDGFIITAFLTSKKETLFKRRIIWQRQK